MPILRTTFPPSCALKTLTLTLAAASLFAGHDALAATPLPLAAPESVGFSREGLARIDQFMAREIAAGRTPGGVIAIARNGKLVHYKAYGKLDPLQDTPMPLDAMFGLASMTKIMAAVGGLALSERGLLPLKSRLGDYLPAFANMQVGSATNGEIKLAPAAPIYIQDLYRHTSGLSYGGSGDSAIHKMMPATSSVAAIQLSGDEFIAKLAAAPLLYQPGTVWEYGFSTDVLGLAIEKVSGKRLGDYLKAEVWDKVGMPDTTFMVPPSKRARLARPLAKDPLTGRDQSIPILDAQLKFDCAGGCAFGTVGDYLRFGQMLVNEGIIDGKRVLSPYTVRLMTSDHLGANIKNNVTSVEPAREGYSFGLAVAVRVNAGVAAMPGSVGNFTWNGANGTAFWADPKERLVVVYGMATPGALRKVYREQISALVYGAMQELPASRKR
ncbi:MAG: serine hydrolase domain-containing protein [Pseudomonadota bacterium]